MVVELALGASAAIFALPLVVVLAHDLVAATLVATNVRLRAQRASPEGREPGI